MTLGKDNIFSIKNIPDFSKKERIIVVGIFGKSCLRNLNKASYLIPVTFNKNNDIECYWDERNGILYLHAVTYFDTGRLTELAYNLDDNSKCAEKDVDAAHWLVASGELAKDSCKILALLFHLCHIVILSSPTPVFDLGYIQIFKAINAYRTELIGPTAAAINSAGLKGVWENYGRSCCPRLLFHFRRAPQPLSKVPAALKRLEHAVEDQLYSILRKSRVITNVCANSLFAIPKNEEFVYISTNEQSRSARDVSSLVRGLVMMCNNNNSDVELPVERQTFKQFLQAHVEQALDEGFDDNVGKYAMSISFFELPDASSWIRAARALTPVYLGESEAEGAVPEGSQGALHDALATEVRFSLARCAKVLLIAQATYTEGLPSHYSSQHHEHQLNVALGVGESMTRGPAAGAALGRLRASCEAIWRSRRLCEALSLTGNPCIQPLHDGSVEHDSGVRYVMACDCGRSRRARDDAYSVRRANRELYDAAAADCAACRQLLRHHFPVLPNESAEQGETTDANENCPENVADDGGCAAEGGGEVEGEGSFEGEACSWSPPDALSPADDDAPPYALTSAAPKEKEERRVQRQVSASARAECMLHAASPADFLPAFASWSLVCLGPSSLYSHSLGLPDHLHPGFLPHTNYLVPWDCPLTAELAGAWRGGGGARGRGKAPPLHLPTVKIFIGMEYECPRGHRFMMSSPESVVSGAGGGGGGFGGCGGGARLAASDMPLWASCACRGAAPAQLMRVHVVTPKASVHVTLDPKVQACEGGATFLAGGPARLSPSAYWVLRLPHVYCDERGPAPRPTRPPPPHQPLAHGRLLAPLFALEQ